MARADSAVEGGRSGRWGAPAGAERTFAPGPRRQEPRRSGWRWDQPPNRSLTAGFVTFPIALRGSSASEKNFYQGQEFLYRLVKALTGGGLA